MSAQMYKTKKVRVVIGRSMVLLGIVFLMTAIFTLQSSLNILKFVHYGSFAVLIVHHGQQTIGVKQTIIGDAFLHPFKYGLLNRLNV